MARDESAARALFDELAGASAWPDVVEQWKTSAAEETNHLEFKLKKTPTHHNIEPDDIAEIAYELSALANTDGGVLVVGVDAGGGDKRGAIPDRVRNLAPIANVDGFRGLVERRIKDWTTPAISGLALTTAKKPDGSGVLAIFVPKSDGGPHRVSGASKETNDRYYMRTAAGSVTMPHSALEAMFHRIAPPKLELVVRSTPQHSVDFYLVNRGRGVARRPAVLLSYTPISMPVNWEGIAGRRLTTGFVARPERALSGESRVLIEAHSARDDQEILIYPGMDRLMLGVPVPTLPANLQISATLYALDARPRFGAGTLHIPAPTTVMFEPQTLTLPAEDT